MFLVAPFHTTASSGGSLCWEKKGFCSCPPHPRLSYHPKSDCTNAGTKLTSQSLVSLLFHWGGKKKIRKRGVCRGVFLKKQTRILEMKTYGRALMNPGALARGHTPGSPHRTPQTRLGPGGLLAQPTPIFGRAQGNCQPPCAGGAPQLLTGGTPAKKKQQTKL